MASNRSMAALIGASAALVVGLVVLYVKATSSAPEPEIAPTVRASASHDEAPGPSTAVPVRAVPARVFLDAAEAPAASDPPIAQAENARGAFDPSSLDLGELEAGDSVTRRVRVKLALTPQQLTVTRPPPGISVEIVPVRAGDSSEIDLRFTVARNAKPIRFDDSIGFGNDYYVLDTKATILAEVLVDPPVIELQKAAEGSLSLQDAVVSSPRGHAFRIVAVEDPQQLVTTTVESREGGGYLLHSTLTKKPDSPFVGGTLLIKTDDPRGATVRLRYAVKSGATP
jgi:hypothetical protein